MYNPGAVIRQLRQSRRLDKPEVAEMLGISRGELTQLELSKDALPPEMLSTIISKLNLTYIEVQRLIWHSRRGRDAANAAQAAPRLTRDIARMRHG